MEPNLYAPDLYARTLDMKFTLINLPGAARAGSTWEVSYQLYFVPEAQFRQALSRSGRSGTVTEPSQFPEKLLLASGSFSGRRLNSPPNRTRVVGGIPFRDKIPDGERTKFATLMLSYSVKIYDAALKSTVYRSGLWLSNPFDDDPAQPQRAVPRGVLYANFYVSPEGELFESQWPRSGNDTSWP
ncbi:MAG: hypothetical protein JOZ96_10725 [Acidobacteria bacterium]|nr:hypothetical protein [Acidobacteriota bacterium]